MEIYTYFHNTTPEISLVAFDWLLLSFLDYVNNAYAGDKMENLHFVVVVGLGQVWG